MKKNLQPFIEISFRKRYITKLLKFHTLEELKQIGYQLVSYGMGAMEDYNNTTGKKYQKITDKDLFW